MVLNQNNWLPSGYFIKKKLGMEHEASQTVNKQYSWFSMRQIAEKRPRIQRDLRKRAFIIIIIVS